VTLPGPTAAIAAEGVVRRLVDAGRLRRAGDRAMDPAHRPASAPPSVVAAMERLVAALDVPAPPSLAAASRAAGCPEAAVRVLERDGRIVRLAADLAWSATAWARLARTALDAASTGPLVPAALRDATGTSRKYVMPLLEDLDRRGILARTPAGHVPGPRAGLIAEPRAGHEQAAGPGPRPREPVA
jgi:selenocysteine-specific elongation factor